ncbi:ferrous iron transport protein A [Candidatus Latescibacterota bacterium]
MVKTVNDMPPGGYGIIKEVNSSPNIKQRFMDMGIIEGAKVTMVRSAPLDDPVEIKVLGTLLALRRIEARTLVIDYLGVTPRDRKKHRYRFGRKSQQR